eukprot:6183712-Pleurochrysis_carterae.AAC.1
MRIPAAARTSGQRSERIGQNKILGYVVDVSHCKRCEAKCFRKENSTFKWHEQEIKMATSSVCNDCKRTEPIEAFTVTYQRWSSNARFTVREIAREQNSFFTPCASLLASGMQQA